MAPPTPTTTPMTTLRVSDDMPDEDPPELASLRPGVLVTVDSEVKEVATPSELVVVITVRMVEVTGTAVVAGVVDDTVEPLAVVSSLLPADVVLVLRVVDSAAGVVVDETAGVLALEMGAAEVVVTTATVVLVEGAAVVVVVMAAADVVVSAAAVVDSAPLAVPDCRLTISSRGSALLKLNHDA